MKSTDFFSKFVTWLNLDFGIETCFYDGMDACSKTWLQFVFPAYIWMLVGLMILLSHFSHTFANVLGNNPISVLETFILLSYTKILRTLHNLYHLLSISWLALDNGGEVCSVFFDLCKAFDSVPHQSLLLKLFQLQVNPFLLRCIHNYLSNRS